MLFGPSPLPTLFSAAYTALVLADLYSWPAVWFAIACLREHQDHQHRAALCGQQRSQGRGPWSSRYLGRGAASIQARIGNTALGIRNSRQGCIILNRQSPHGSRFSIIRASVLSPRGSQSTLSTSRPTPRHKSETKQFQRQQE